MPGRWLLCAGTIWAAAAHAQTLSAVLRLAQESDPVYLAVRAQSESAVYRVGEARAAHLPQVGVTLSGVRSTTNVPYASPPVATERDANVAVSVQETLFSRANDLAIKQAELGRDQSTMSLAEAEQDLIMRVAQAYFGVLSAKGALESARSSEQAIADQLAATKQGFAAGTLAGTDTLEARARCDLAAEQSLLAENDLERQRIALSRVAGRPGIEPVPLATPFVPPPLETSRVEDWLRKAEAASPALQRAQASMDIASLEAERARATRLPTIAARASIARARSHYDFEAAEGTPAISGSGTLANSQVAIIVSVPLFSGFYIQNRVNEAGKLADKARFDYESALNEVDSSTQSALSTATIGFLRLKNLEAAAQSSADAYESTRLGFKVGMKTNIEVLNARAQLFLTQRAVIVARYNQLLAILQLRRVSGELNESDLAAMDRLLVSE